MVAQRFLVKGKVQGVGYRQWMADRARELDLRGWVRNLHGGEVEAHVQGVATAVEELASECRVGPSHANVLAVIREDVAELNEIDDFTIQRDSVLRKKV